MAVASAERCSGTLCPCYDGPQVTDKKVEGCIKRSASCDNFCFVIPPFVKRGRAAHHCRGQLDSLKFSPKLEYVMGKRGLQVALGSAPVATLDKFETNL